MPSGAPIHRISAVGKTPDINSFFNGARSMVPVGRVGQATLLENTRKAPLPTGCHPNAASAQRAGKDAGQPGLTSVIVGHAAR